MIEKTIAKSLSVLFHPILYPMYSILLLFFFDHLFVVKTLYQIKLYVFGVVFLNTIIMPLLLMWFLQKRGMISSIRLAKREERIYPLIVSLLFYISTWYLISPLQLIPLYTYILALSSVLTALAIGVSIFFKISLHSFGAAGFSTALLAISYVYSIQFPFLIIVAFVLTGLIASSRLILKAHKPVQVYVGLILGFFIGMFSVLFL